MFIIADNNTNDFYNPNSTKAGKKCLEKVWSAGRLVEPLESKTSVTGAFLTYIY